MLYAFFISFFIVFCSELGDKTQLLVLSFSTKSKISSILLGVGLGTFFSHGLAILFGSSIGSLNNASFKFYLDIITYLSFLVFGIIGFIPKKNENSNNNKFNFLQHILNLKINYVFIIALSIFIGEIGDKTFLASLGLGLQYPTFKIALILGSIFGMILSNLFAIIFGKFLSHKLKEGTIEWLSNILFIVFGILGFASLIF
jgi:putative Ca2+/H+ antiporter (TMEM165/GDT1 family)